MSYLAGGAAAESATRNRIASFIGERRCFTYNCPATATTLIRRTDGVEVPKCKGHAKLYGEGCCSRPIVEVA